MVIRGTGGVLATPLGQQIASVLEWTLTRDGAAVVFACTVTLSHIQRFWWTQATHGRVSLSVHERTWHWRNVPLPERAAETTSLTLTLTDHPIVT